MPEDKNKNYINSYQDERLSNIEKHIEVINGELKEVKTDLSWVKKFLWLVIGASVSALIVGLFNLLLK